MENIEKKLNSIIQPSTIDDLNIVEVLDVEFNIKAAMINGELILPDGVLMPSEDEILSAKQNLLTKYESNLYAKQRAVMYPSVVNQLDAIYHDIINGVLTDPSQSTFVQMIQSIKDSYPK